MKPRATDAELLALRKGGLWFREIAAQIGVSPAAVRQRFRRLRRRGVTVPRPRRRPAHPLRRVTDEQLLSLRKAGFWSSQIAARVGLRVGTVRQRLQRLQQRGIAVPPAIGPRPNAHRRVTDDQLRTLASAQISCREMARRWNLHPATVERRVRRLRQRGLLPQRVPSPRGLPDGELLALRAAGLSAREIAARTGLTQSNVEYCVARLRRRGVAVPAPRRPAVAEASRARDQAILALTRTGLPPARIAVRVGLRPAAVRIRLASLRRRSLLARPQRPAPVPSRAILRLWRAGLRDSQIAARTGTTRGAVRARLRALRRRGIAVPRRRDPEQQRTRDEQIVASVRAGQPIADLASRLGVAKASVYRRLRALRGRALRLTSPVSTV